MRFWSLLAFTSLVTASSLTPPVLPLIVRNPYLSTWLGNARHDPWEDWPMFYTGAHIGFSVMISVPDTKTVYPLLGRPHDSLPSSPRSYNILTPTYLGATFDASTTNLTYLIVSSKSPHVSAKVILSFLSPITPTSTFRQSIPAAYLTVLAEGNLDLNLYVDTNGEWVSGNRENKIVWELNEDAIDSDNEVPIKTWKVSRASQELLTEFADRAEWGTFHFTGPSSLDHQSGTSAILRQRFAEKGSLANKVDNSFRKIMEEEPVFAFSKSFKLGNLSNSHTTPTIEKVMFTFALTQDPVVQFAAARGLTYMRPLWSSYLASSNELIQYHYRDFKAANTLAQNYSDQLSIDAYQSGSQDYRDIASLSARQVLGATQFSGTPENPIIFLKEISSNGNFQTVDVIFPSFPFFLYTNPRWLAYLLEPLLEHQLSGQYPNDYSMHDLGSHFPNATGHPDGRDEYMPVEECGNMVIMGLALVNAFKYETRSAFTSSLSGELASHIVVKELAAGQEPFALAVDEYGMDRPYGRGQTSGKDEAERWVSKSYNLWKQWTGYLVRESLIPANQLCTDDFAGWLANQTNLALKGIIGIKAMSEIAYTLHAKADYEYFQEIADEYIEKWQEFAISRDGTHAKLAYTWYGSWTTIYNLYADSLLCFHLSTDQGQSIGDRFSRWWRTVRGGKANPTFIPDKIYSMQSRWYHAVLQTYGLPLDSRHLYTKSDWQFFAAAVASKKTRTEILQSIALWVNETSTDRPLTDLYETEGTGGWPGARFMARPVVGGHFAFLALERACGGRAIEGLRFLDEDDESQTWEVDIEQALRADIAEAEQLLVSDQQMVLADDL